MELDVFLEKVYSEVNENIKFSEAKNAALITLNSALIACAGTIVFDNDISFVYRYLIGSFAMLLMVPIICSVMSFRATTGSENLIIRMLYSYLDSTNMISITPKKYMYYAYIHKHYENNPEKYLHDISSGMKISHVIETYYTQIARQIVDLSKVAYRKFVLFNIAIKIECLILFFGGIGAFILLFIEYLTRSFF